jgi:hypothetical protein
MNCSHSDTGWCLDCVKELWDEMNKYEEALEKISNSPSNDLDYLKAIAVIALEAESD